MGYDLAPRNKELESFHFGAFSFPVLLEACGYLWPAIHGGARWYMIGGVDPRLGGSYPAILSNDGFRVTALEARIMARVARNYVAIQRSLGPEYAVDDWAKPEYQRVWPRKIRDDFVDRFEAFAPWAERSGGFAIW